MQRQAAAVLRIAAAGSAANINARASGFLIIVISSFAIDSLRSI